MTDREIDNALLHEQGEYQAGQILGDDAWNAMLLDLAQTPAELMARAVRDHLADCLVTLPRIGDKLDADANPASQPASQPLSSPMSVSQQGVAALHFYLGNLTNMRKSIFPALAAAYAGWLADGDIASLREVAERGRLHWQRLGLDMIALHRASGAEAAAQIRTLVSGAHL
jgi:hypothetical protein